MSRKQLEGEPVSIEKGRIVFLNGVTSPGKSVIIDGILTRREGAASYYVRMTEIPRELF